jgi:hypothetical protein
VHGVLAHVRVPFADIRSVRVGRAPGERVRGERSVVIERQQGAPLLVGTVAAAGALFELADRLAELSSEHAARNTRVVVVLPLLPGTAPLAEELLVAGPPFDPSQTRLEEHYVFVTEQEVVFLFEGPDAADIVQHMVRNPRVLKQAARWRCCLAGRPRVAEQHYAWARNP